MCYQFCSTRTTYQLCRTTRRYQFCKIRIDCYQFHWVFDKTFPIKKIWCDFCWLTILWTTCNPRNPGISSRWIIQCDSTSNVLFSFNCYLSNDHWIWELVLTILVHPFNIGCFTNKHKTIPNRFLLLTILLKEWSLVPFLYILLKFF
jgi:hypothetical protein